MNKLDSTPSHNSHYVPMGGAEDAAIQLGSDPTKEVEMSQFDKKVKDVQDEPAEILTSSKETFVRKCMGGNSTPPLSSSLEQSLVTFAGAFITLLSLSIFYSFVNKVSNGKYNILLAPFGALVTLQFGLTKAPPAQPRAAIYGELIALPISILCNSIPHNILPSWIEIALAPSLGLGIMQYLGLTHPPAGAAAIVFSAMDYSWIHMILFEVGVFICIFWSMVVNNLNTTRQYPIYWSLWPVAK